MDQMLAEQDVEGQSDFLAQATTIDEQELINSSLLKQLEMRRRQIAYGRTVVTVSASAVIVLAIGLVILAVWSLDFSGASRSHVESLVTILSSLLLSGIVSALIFLKVWLNKNLALQEADYLIEKNRLALQLMHSAVEKGQVAGRG